MALSSLYMDTPSVDISGTIANLRKEESDRKAKNWKSAQDLLRGAATDAIRSKYADQIDWEQGVEYADKVFKAQYDRLMAVDPAAAQQLASEYKIEREKRITKATADAYKKGSNEQDPELKALEEEIAALDASIASSEMEAKNWKSAQGRAETQMGGYTPQPGSGSGLRSFYGSAPVPPQQALPQPMSGVQVPQNGAEAYGMQNYRPLDAWYKGGR